jgi:hypothetical protein
VFIDDADDLQTQCHDDGIPISSALDRLVGMAYADDLKTVSGTHAGLQNIIIKSNATLSAGQRTLPRVIHRCQTLVVLGPDNEPVDQDIPDVFMWGDTPLQQDRGQALSLIITDDCWEKQAQGCCRKGLAAFTLVEARPQKTLT